MKALYHLADFLLQKEYSIYSMLYGDTKNIDHLRDKISILRRDLKDSGRVQEIIDMVKPDNVFHLAAQSFVTVSWENPEEILNVNVLGTFRLLDSIRKTDVNPLVQVVG